MKKFLAAQLNAIEKDIYLESEKAKRNLRFDNQGNPSQDVIIKWVAKHAEGFRNAWPNSICKECEKTFTCHNCLKEKCEFYSPEGKNGNQENC